MATSTSSFEGMNLLQPTGFKIVINRGRFKNLEFFAQSVNHPSVSLGVAEQSFRRSNVYFPGDKLQYGELTVQAIVDENINVYSEVYDWMQSLVEVARGGPSTKSVTNQDNSEYDMKIIILSSSNTQTKSFQYNDTFPISIGDMILNSAVGGVEYIILPITFKYSTFALSTAT